MPTPRKYPDELSERARFVLVLKIRKERGSRHGVIPEVAARLGVDDQSLRLWVKQAEVDGGQRPGTSTADALRSPSWNVKCVICGGSNEILKAASAFFARELDPRLPR